LHHFTKAKQFNPLEGSGTKGAETPFPSAFQSRTQSDLKALEYGEAQIDGIQNEDSPKP